VKLKNKITLLKTFSWYLFHFAMVSLLGKIITSEWTTGMKLASAEMIVETALFYFHENMWVRIKEKLWN
jgi:uncharacterized membrane protein